jgi:hypothetical protein
MASTATRTPAPAGSPTTAPDPLTGSARGVVGPGFCLGLDGESAVVVAAVGTDVVRELHLVAVRTLLEVWQLDGEVRATLTLAGMRDTSLRYTHGVVVLLVVGARSDSETALGR